MKMDFERHKGYKITVEIDKPVSEYAIDFLHIYNNVKARRWFSMYNDYGNKVTVVCIWHEKDGLADYLKQFGEITDERECVLIESWMSLNDADFKEIYEEKGMEVEFLMPDCD